MKNTIKFIKVLWEDKIWNSFEKWVQIDFGSSADYQWLWHVENNRSKEKKQ